MSNRKYYLSEREYQQQLLQEGFFNGDKGGGQLFARCYPFVLQNGENNLYAPIMDESLNYFKENKIKWWGGKLPSGHILSSQIACINHLMSFRKDATAVLKLINGISNIFKAVHPIPLDKDESYIAFETVSSEDYLNEGKTTRGSNCTSVDALILGVDHNDKVWLLLIEWKYTESYSDSPSNDKSRGEKGITREKRYTELINKSSQLKSIEDYSGSIYYFEPFYQLMRQTLWAEQMLVHKEIKADLYMHVHVVPSRNWDLRDKKYRLSGKGMEETWREMIIDQSKYILIDPKKLLEPVSGLNNELMEYLSKRYWNNENH